jgi:hypothetical protein
MVRSVLRGDSLLFNDPVILKELYCAIEGVNIPPEIQVTINTLHDVLFKDRINDISFEIGGKLVVLIEHQSTINPNMALRLLSYIARVYEKIIGDKNVYSTKQIKLPRPEFFVLYNGAAPYPDEAKIKLSESFEKVDFPGIDKKDNPVLDLEVKVININYGRNEEIARKSKTLSSYSAFVAKVREYVAEGNDFEPSVRKAVVYCREHDILKEFLEKHATEVINMLSVEWSWEDALDVRFAEGWEGGEEKKCLEIARKALAEGATIEFVYRITGLDFDIIENLASEY